MKLITNAASIYTNIGDGKYGFLRLTVSEVQYNTVALIPFVAPTNSGIIIYSVNVSVPKMAKKKEAHDLATRSFENIPLPTIPLNNCFSTLLKTNTTVSYATT